MRNKIREKYMMVKIDLKKAYDCLCWEFIEDSLRDPKFPKPFIKIVMSCVYTFFMQVL